MVSAQILEVRNWKVRMPQAARKVKMERMVPRVSGFSSSSSSDWKVAIWVEEMEPVESGSVGGES